MSSHVTPYEAHIAAIVLAAGQGKRMQSPLPKVAHTLLGKPMVRHVVDSLVRCGVRECVTVLSPHQNQVRNILAQATYPEGVRVDTALQDPPLGTGHAAQCGFGVLKNLVKNSKEKTDVIVAFGDTPAIRAETFRAFVEFHAKEDNVFTILAFNAKDPTGYGRVLQESGGRFQAIREHKDCSEAELKVTLCNSGLLCGSLDAFERYLPQLKNDNRAKEYYLTDLPGLARESGQRAGVFIGPDEQELAGVNSQAQLADMARVLQRRIVQGWMERGVQFLDPDAVYVEETITFEPGVIVEPFVFLAGKHHFPQGSRVRAGTRTES